MQNRTVFKDRSLDQEFASQGYVIVPLLSSEHLDQIRTLHNDLNSGIKEGFYSSLFSQDSNYKRAVDEALFEICKDLPGQYLNKYKWLGANFMVKMPGKSSELAIHQDWMLVNEENFYSVNCWFPLTEITPENGPLKVMPGSHLKFKGIRGSPRYPSSLDNLRDVIRDKYLVETRPKLGEAVLFNSALVHYSPENRSSETRLAASINMIPEEASPIHYYWDSNGDVELYEVDREFFQEFCIGQKPQRKLVKKITGLKVDALTENELFGSVDLRKKSKFTEKLLQLVGLGG